MANEQKLHGGGSPSSGKHKVAIAIATVLILLIVGGVAWLVVSSRQFFNLLSQSETAKLATYASSTTQFSVPGDFTLRLGDSIASQDGYYKIKISQVMYQKAPSRYDVVTLSVTIGSSTQIINLVDRRASGVQSAGRTAVVGDLWIASTGSAGEDSNTVYKFRVSRPGE